MLRGVLPKGAGWTLRQEETAILSAMAAAILTLSVARFSKTME